MPSSVHLDMGKASPPGTPPVAYAVGPIGDIGEPLGGMSSLRITAAGGQPQLILDTPWCLARPVFRVVCPRTSSDRRGRFPLRWPGRSRIVYQVTDRRVLITTGIRHTWAQLDVTQCALAQPLPPEVRDGSVFMNLAWPPRGGHRYSWDQLMWPAASADPPPRFPDRFLSWDRPVGSPPFSAWCLAS